jgi:CubicO group peptidase (beta-lactamase class C family)
MLEHLLEVSLMISKSTFSGLLVLAFCSVTVHAGQFEWSSAPPHEVGLSDEGIGRMLENLRNHSTDALLVVRHDRICSEWYSERAGPDRPHYTASLAKALAGGMSLAVALSDGLLTVDDAASKHIAAWSGDPTRAGITLRHLATHSSGVEDAEVNGMGHMESGGWKTRFWKRSPDPFTIARDWAPMKFKPGESFEYSNPGMAMLAWAITSALQNSRQKDIRSLLRERIFLPIGIRDSEWSVGYGETSEVDGLRLVAIWGGGSFTARAAVRVGRLMLRRGDWEGKRIFDDAVARLVTSDAGTPTPYRGPGEGPCPRAGLCWWVNSDRVLARLPADAFIGAGAGNQVLLVIPSLDLIAVRFGEILVRGNFWGGIEEYLLNPLMDCIEH